MMWQLFVFDAPGALALFIACLRDDERFSDGGVWGGGQ